MKKELFVLVVGIIIFSLSCKKAKIPVLVTTEVTELTTTSAVSGGQIKNNGGARIIEQGICWNTSPDPVTGDNKAIQTGSDLFTCNITNLSASTQYYVRAFATNEAGTGYGQTIAFKTVGDKPVVTAQPAINISTNSATLKGSVNPNYLTAVVKFEYGITTSFEISGTFTGQIPVDGNSHDVTLDITGLTPGTLYYFRIKGENSLGTSISSNLTFTTAGQKPAVSTLPIMDATQNSVTLSAMVNPNQLATQVFFEWGPTTSYGNTLTPTPNNLTGSTNTNIVLTLSGLQKGTEYHYRVKAVNELGTSYGQDFQFSTLAEPLVITSYISTGITTAVSGGQITNDFGSAITEKGICWSPYPEPDIFENKILYSGADKTFKANISGLNQNSTYYVRAFAKNSVGIGYGEDIIIKTYTDSISDLEGNTYYTVTIGTQVWMAENLKSKKFLNGDPISTTTGDIQTQLNPEYQWAYENNENNVPVYGRLYTWFAIKDSRKICPTGWHVPSMDEASTLNYYLGGYLTNAGMLKEAGTTHWKSPNTGATNSSGFTALPGGYRSEVGAFLILSEFGHWWTATESTFGSGEYGYTISLYSGSIVSSFGGSGKKVTGRSLRCIKD
jgi:uncharacterized protein (TIGR02145 family)